MIVNLIIGYLPITQVVLLELSNDYDIIDKFKSQTNDPNELISVFKAPNSGDNHLELLNLEELERNLYSKQSGIIIAFIIIKNKSAFIYFFI